METNPRTLSLVNRYPVFIRLAVMVIALAGLFALQSSGVAHAGGTCIVSSSGSWGDNNIWSCGYIPGSADDVYINPSVTVTLDTTRYANNLYIFSGSVLNMNGNSFVLYNNFNSSGGTAFILGSGTFNFLGGTELCGGSTNIYFESALVNFAIPAVNSATCTNGMTAGTLYVASGNLIMKTASTLSGVRIQNTGTLSLGTGVNQSMNNLTIDSGGTLDAGSQVVTVSGTTTNAGTIKRLAPAQTITSGSTFTFNDGINQATTIINQTGGTAMGNTTVQINANTTISYTCGTTLLGGTPAKRYFDIAPTGNSANVTADLTLYFYSGASNSKANGNSSNMAIYHCNNNTTWERLAGNYTEGTSGNYTWVKLTGYNFTSFSPFAAGGGPGNPTAVTLSSFRATTPSFDLGAWLRKMLGQ